MSHLRLGVDIGGTFVDAILYNPETQSIALAKSSTTPADPTVGVLDAIDKLNVDLSDIELIVHGTTLGLNAVIERRGAAVGLLTNEGFRDIFELGRGDVPYTEMYNLHYRRTEPLVPRRRIRGVPGRIEASGSAVTPLDEEAVIRASDELVEQYDIESLAICFLHSYANPEPESCAAKLIRERHPSLKISESHRVVREFREYERTCTTLLDAYIRPIFERYVGRLADTLEQRGFDGNFYIMRSGGGAMTARAARTSPLDSVLSGPSGGIVGAAALASELNITDLLTMDFGGTSLDTCVIQDGAAAVVHETTLQDLPALIPCFDIRCIGAGGGSIGWLEHGMLQVGPHSAGADPGPIAYGRGGLEPTVTDAAIVLGYIDPARFVGGDLALDTQAAENGIRNALAKPMQVDLQEAAAGVFAVLVAQTEGAVREITVEQGRDPQDFTGLAFGGAGPLLAPLVAMEIGIPRIIVPRVPSVFSAWGMLMADITTDTSRTFVDTLRDEMLEEANAQFRELESQTNQNLAEQGVAPANRQQRRYMDLRYVGQEHTLKIEVDADTSSQDIRRRFDQAHEQRFGHKSEQPVEVITLRVTGIGSTPKPQMDRLGSPRSAGSSEVREAWCFAKNTMTPFTVVERESLAPGSSVEGPAVIAEATTTTVIHSGQLIVVDDYGNLIVHTSGSVSEGRRA